MKHKEIEIQDYSEFQERFRQELENIEDIIPEEIMEKEKEILRKYSINSFLLIAGGIATILGVLIPGWTPVAALGVIVSFITALSFRGKFKSLKKLRQKATATLSYLKQKIQNTWKFFTGKRKTQRQVSLSSSMRKVKKQSKGVIFGTLAKLADEEGINVGLLRFAFILAGIFSGFFPVFIGYIALSIVKNSRNSSRKTVKKSSYQKKRYSKTVTYSYESKPNKFSKYERWEYWDY